MHTGKTLYPSMVTVPMTTQMTIELPTILAGPSATISIGNLSALCQTSQASVLIGLKLTLVQQVLLPTVACHSLELQAKQHSAPGCSMHLYDIPKPVLTLQTMYKACSVLAQSDAFNGSMLSAPQI